MRKCHLCKKVVNFPFKCAYCGHYFCAEHRLPEKHRCSNLPKRTWDTRKNNGKNVEEKT